MTRSLEPLAIQLVDRSIHVRFESDRASRFLLENYGHLRTSIDSHLVSSPALEYVVGEERDSSFYIQRSATGIKGLSERKLLLAFDYDLMIQLQLQRPDLLFLHSAVVEFEDRGVLLSAPAGTGKSTLAWSLQHEGFRYLSDELAPIDPVRLQVHSFPRAICLKTDPPLPYRLPDDVVRTSGTIHVPARSLPTNPVTDPVKLGALVFPRRDSDHDRPSVRRLSPAEGTARLYSNALNLSAHPNSGLDVSIRLAKGHPCFELVMTDLASAAEAIRETVATNL